MKGMKICELKLNDMASVESITRILLLNGYTVQAYARCKPFPQETCIDYFRIEVFDDQTEKVCTGEGCSTQVGYDVENEWKRCANTEMAIYILEFIKRNYEKHHKDEGVKKYTEALQMSIDALRKQKEGVE